VACFFCRQLLDLKRSMRANDAAPAPLRKSPPTSDSTPSTTATSTNSRPSINSAVAGSANDSPAYHNHYRPVPSPTARARYSVTEKSSSDLLGQRFDSAAVLNSYDALHHTQSLAFSPAQQPYSPRPAEPIHSHTTGSSPAFTNTASRLSQAIAVAGRRMEDLAPRGDLGNRSPRQRYSDEARESNKLKKKSGFSSFMKDLVGTPRRPAISAPENPVHVTHVGYDSNTGEFTVGYIFRAVADLRKLYQLLLIYYHAKPVWTWPSLAN
jgi:p21-activated kinase 1